MKLKRSVAKAITYKILSVAVSALVMWWLSGSAMFAVKGFAILSPLTFIIYIIHERIWYKIPFGRKEVHDKLEEQLEKQ